MANRSTKLRRARKALSQGELFLFRSDKERKNFFDGVQYLAWGQRGGVEVPDELLVYLKAKYGDKLIH